MQASFDAAMAQKQALEDDATATQRKMDSANALLSALAGEEGRWTQQSKEFDDTIQKLTGGKITCHHILSAKMLVCHTAGQPDLTCIHLLGLLTLLQQYAQSVQVCKQHC